MPFTRRTLDLVAASVTAAGAAIDDVVRALTAAWARTWDRLEAAFIAALEAYADGEEWPSRRIIDRDPSIRQALTDAGRALAALAALAASSATGAATTAARQAAADQAAIIASQLPPGYPPDLPSPELGFLQRSVLAIQARTAEQITALTRPLAGEAVTAMRRELIRGVLFGRNPRDIARLILQRVQGAFNGGLTRALVIARTEVMDAYRRAAAAMQNASSGVLNGWVWLAQLDRRTCGTCWVMHGTTHPLSEPGPQGHPQCRCTRAPEVVSWADLGFTGLDEPDSLIPDAQASFAALSRADQLQIMGPSRLALLDNGQVAWRDLVQLRDNPGWRPSYKPTPVSALTA